MLQRGLPLRDGAKSLLIVVSHALALNQLAICGVSNGLPSLDGPGADPAGLPPNPSFTGDEDEDCALRIRSNFGALWLSPDLWAEGTRVMNTYATLINRKVVVPSQKTNYLAVDMHYFSSCHRAELMRIAFDSDWYLIHYPDIAEAVTAGRIASAQEHYVGIGYYEHRMPYEIVVDEEWYLKEYPDIGRAVVNQDFPSGQIHFEDQGFREGRLPYPHFRLKTTSRPD